MPGAVAGLLWISAELPNGAGKPKQLVYNADVTGK
jgi:hypothetical protein